MDVLRKKFRFCTYPTKNLCIDESLMLWKGRLIFKVYIPSKRNRFGIKFFLLVDCASKIVLDFIIYTGHESQIKMNNEVGISGSIVMTMMAPFLNKGHNLYVDNWYSSPNLFKLLYNNKTGACGTVRKNRTGMPKLERRLNQGEVENKCDGNMLALKWKDKREVHMLSTIHDSSMIKTRKRKRNGMFVYKPICVHDYSQNMGGVDKVDMQISFTESIRKTVKWSKKVFFHMLDLSIFNSYAIYKHKKTLELSFYEFKLDLVRNIFEKYKQQEFPKQSTFDPNSRLRGRHFPQKREKRKQCVVCKVRKNDQSIRSFIYCKQCNVALCVDGCFEIYHTVENLENKSS